MERSLSLALAAIIYRILDREPSDALVPLSDWNCLTSGAGF